MRSAALFLTIACCCLTGCESMNSETAGRILQGLAASSQAMDGQTIVNGLKEALRVGTDRTVSTTSATGGYANNELIRIELPESFSKVTTTLRTVGYGPQVDALEQKMNAAAEEAAAQATPIFVDAVTRMSFADAKAILEGSDTAATDYFREQTRADLMALYQPIVQSKLSEVGAVKSYQDIMSRYNKIPLVPKTTFSLTDHVSNEALDGIFVVLAQEEKKIREDPAARTTAILRQVFGQK